MWFQSKPTVFVFFPVKCKAPGLLHGWTRLRNEPFQLTVVVLGTLPPGRSSPQMESILPDGEFQQLGVLQDSLSESTAPDKIPIVWMEWILNPEKANNKLSQVVIQLPHPECLAVKVFFYSRPRLDESHFPALAFSSDRTSFAFAVDAINTAPLFTQVELYNQTVSSFSLPEPSASVVYIPFQTGRLLQSWWMRLKPQRAKIEQWNALQLNERFLQSRHRLICRLLDCFSALFLVYFLVIHKDTIFITLKGCVEWLYGFLIEQAEWLSGAPGGIKLHRPLATFYASFLHTTAIWMFALHNHLISTLTQIFIPGLLLSVIGGTSLILSLATDLLYFASFPVTLLYTVFSFGMKLHLIGLRLTWRLLRGKYAQEKRKRKRKNAGQQDHLFGQEKSTKDDEVLMEHLIVGVLLFTPLLALIPTTFLFFSVVFTFHLTTLILRLLLTLLIHLIENNPLILIFLRGTHPGLFPGSLQVKSLEVGDKESRWSYYEVGILPKRAASCCKLINFSEMWNGWFVFYTSFVFPGIALGLQP